MQKACPDQHPIETQAEKITSMVVLTCEAEIDESWIGKVTVAAFLMADSYWSCASLREFLEI